MRRVNNFNINTFLFLFLIFGSSYNASSQTDMDSLEKALEVVEGTPRVDLLVRISDFYNFNDARKSVVYANEALNLARNLNYKAGIQKGLHSLGRAYYQLLDYENALLNFREEIRYIDIESNPLALVSIYNSIGIIYEILGDYENAILHHKKGLSLLKTNPDSSLSADAKLNINLAIDYNSLGETDSARYFIENTEQILNDSLFSDINLKIHIQIYIAELLYYLGDSQEAHKLITEALENKKYITDKYAMSSLYLVLGKIYELNEEYTKAKDSFKKTIMLAQEVGQARREMEARKLLSDLYKKNGKYNLALEELKKYDKVKDSTTTADKNRHILEIEARYASETQQDEIELLKKETAINNSKLARSRMKGYYLGSMALIASLIFIVIYNAYRYKKKTNKELAVINKELIKSKTNLQELNSIKDSLIRVIGHDLKGPLGTVIGFAELISQKAAEKNKQEIIRNSKLIHKASENINYLLDNILYWARLQRGGYQLNNKDFNISESILQAVTLYQPMAEKKRISVEIEVEETLVAYGDSFALGILINNLLSNAIKFSFFDSVIKIIATKKSDKIQFSIIDKGIGMDIETRNNLFDSYIFNSTLGTNNEKGTGFGLKICKQFIDLTGGKIWVESEMKQGSSFHFAIPVKS